MTWAEFQQAISDKYYNVAIRASKVDEFATLTQGNITVTEYALKFDRLAKFTADLVPTNATRVDRFVRGLKYMIARYVEIVLVWGHNTYAQKRKGSDQARQSSQDKREKDSRGNNRTGNKEWKSQEGAKEQHRKEDNLVPARVFALTKPQEEASTSVVSGQIFIAAINCHILFDSGATHSFVAKRVVDRFNRPNEMHAMGLGTMLPTGEVVISRKWFRALPLRVDGRELFVDLIELDMTYFDVILGMDWLKKYNATIDCKKKMVVFKSDGEEPFAFVGTATGLRIPIILALEVRKMLQYGCMGFLASVINTTKTGTQSLEDKRMVRDYLMYF
ncbi:uncharacterized protein LOC133785662 [Humulus lupulus]|uniref:uncharacterized protein LOC133785662 n=1 Tax=Humulus lupulus TaxID=3486 RepID=UPI002B400A7B|nr:uncharacterized protein LOC133785662 [Humulus lupulus]